MAKGIEYWVVEEDMNLHHLKNKNSEFKDKMF